MNKENILQTGPPGDDSAVVAVYDQVKWTDELDANYEEFQISGYTVLQNAVPANLLEAAQDRLDELECKQLEFLKKQGLQVGSHKGVVRFPLLQDNLFLQLSTLPNVMTLIRRCLGEFFVLISQVGIINRPATSLYPHKFHRDLNYQHWTSGNVGIALNFLIALDDFTEENGATRAVPGTHRYSPCPSDSYLKKHEQIICAPAGSVIVMNAMTFHRAGRNTTQSAVRRGLNHIAGRPFLLPGADLPALLAEQGKDYSDDAFLRNYLGYRWQPVKNLEKWFRDRQN